MANILKAADCIHLLPKALIYSGSADVKPVLHGSGGVVGGDLLAPFALRGPH